MSNLYNERYAAQKELERDMAQVIDVFSASFSERHLVAEHLAKLGWRPPAQVLNEENEIEAMPPYSVVKDRAGKVWGKAPAGMWFQPVGEGHQTNYTLAERAPLTVISDPRN